MPDVSFAPLEDLFRARVITSLVKKGRLPPERTNMLHGWKHYRFNIHRSQRVPPRNREDMERLARYIIRNPFSVDKMQPNSSGHSIIYRSGMNPKIHHNFAILALEASLMEFHICLIPSFSLILEDHPVSVFNRDASSTLASTS